MGVHVDSPNGTLMAINSDNLREYPVIEGTTVHDPDDLNKVKQRHSDGQRDTEIFPPLNNYNPHTQSWDTGVGECARGPEQERRVSQQIMRFLAAYPVYRGLSLDYRKHPRRCRSRLPSFIQALYGEMHARNLRLYVNVAVSTSDSDLKPIAANSDGIILMNYDEHQTTSDPGPVASQPGSSAIWSACSRSCPRKKSSARVGNYGYDWTLSIPNPKDRHHPKPEVLDTEDLSVSDAWQRASDADADLDLDYDTLNPHFEYIDEDTNQRHVVWFLDARHRCSTRCAPRAQLGLQTFALWRLGEEDSSLWNIWDQPSDPDSLQALGDRPARPRRGHRG